jgi:hypothetical protein
MPTLFDPLAWLATKKAVATLAADGSVALQFDQFTKPEMRARIRRVIRHWETLLRMQLDVAPGDRPRTVQQLIASGKIRVVEGRYVLVEKG